MNLLIATVMHSGTFALLKLLGWPARESRMVTEADEGLLFGHLDDTAMPHVIEAAKRMDVITTDRDPALIRQSWINRGSDLAELDRQLSNYARLMALEPKPFTVKIWR